MADTQFIKRTIEPYMRQWLQARTGKAFAERSLPVANGSFAFDAVSSDESTVGLFLCSRPKTSTGNVNTGAVRKALNDLMYLKLAAAPLRLVVFTDAGFLDLVTRRSKRVGLDEIELLHCQLPAELQAQLDETLDASSREQTTSSTRDLA